MFKKSRERAAFAHGGDLCRRPHRYGKSLIFYTVDDLALIDDDALTRKIWVLRGRDLNMKVAAFENLDEFRRANVSAKTPIYIDYHMASGVSGFDVAELLKRDGYQRLSITTADDRIREIPPYVISVQGKEFPET